MSEQDIKKHLDLVSSSLEKELNKFQSDMVTWQTRITQLWNVMNVLIRVLHNKGLISEEDLEAAGTQLFREFQENLEITKKAIAEKRKPETGELKSTPMEDLIMGTNRAIEKAKQ